MEMSLKANLRMTKSTVLVHTLSQTGEDMKVIIKMAKNLESMSTTPAPTVLAKRSYGRKEVRLVTKLVYVNLTK